MGGKCCGRCKTPYNCGNPLCNCHTAAVQQVTDWARVEREHERTGRMFKEDARETVFPGMPPETAQGAAMERHADRRRLQRAREKGESDEHGDSSG